MGRRLQKQSRIGAIALVCLVSIAAHAAVAEASVQYTLDTVFANNDGSHASGLNYITATFTTVSTGTVRMELQSNLSTLGLATGNTQTTGYLIRNVYLQLGATSTNTTGLGIGSGVNFLTGTGNSTGLVYPNGGSSLGTSASSTQQADTEDFFNLRLGFDGIASATNALSANRFDDNDKAVFNLVRTGLTESSFTFLGASGGGPLRLFMAAEILNAAAVTEGSPVGTFYVGAAVPEATSIAVWSLLVVAGACLTCWRRFA